MHIYNNKVTGGAKAILSLLPLCLFAAVMLLASCDNISEDERFIYVKPADVKRRVLIEDFTGQRCVNCPAAHEEIDRLQEQYGDSFGYDISTDATGGELLEHPDCLIPEYVGALETYALLERRGPAGQIPAIVFDIFLSLPGRRCNFPVVFRHTGPCR